MGFLFNLLGPLIPLPLRSIQWSRFPKNKMASIIITCIHSALDDVELLVNACNQLYYEYKMLKILRFRLRNLKTFVLSAIKLRNDGILGSFFVRIENIIRKNTEEIHPHCLHLNGPATGLHFSMASAFLNDIRSLEEEIDEWYVTMLDYTRQSSSLMTDEVLEIISSFLENLVDLQCLGWSLLHVEILGEAMEALGEHMTFLKSLIRFATQRSVEPREALLAHSEAVAINAAYLLFTYKVNVFDDKSSGGMQVKISTLLQKIKPIDPQVYETYTQALSSSKLSRRLLAPTQAMDDSALIAMKNFLDSLISKIWEMLRLNTCRVVSMKDQLQDLHEVLRYLRSVLKQQSNNFDMKIKEDIGDVVCDAGVLVCSFYQTSVEVDVGLQDLLEAIKIILAEVGVKDPPIPIFNFLRTNQLGFVDFLLEKLTQLASCETEPTAKSHVQTIREELIFLRSFSREIVELRNEHEELQSLWDRVLEVTYRIECLIDHLVVGDLSDSFSTSFDSIINDIGNIKADRLQIFHGKRLEIQVNEVTRTNSHVPSQRTPNITNEVVGFEEKARSIVDRLTRGPKQLRIVAIVGMAGLGKTTLAKKVYNDPSVLRHFYVRAWCPISQVVDKKKVLLDLLNQIDPNIYSEMTEQDLVEKLWRCLKGRRYLIFLDDIWDIEAWNSLGGSFPDDSVGSRIILTSRHHDVAPYHILDQEPHFLSQLNKEESLELLQRKLILGNGWPPGLSDLGMQIAEKCKGLPLTIVIVAGILATKELEGWKEILDSLSLGVVSSTEHCNNTLELSYKHLPDYLRPCLLYFGTFREDQEVSVRRLLCLWIAEGFVRKDKMKSLEDVAEDYLKELIGRSLIMVAEQRSDGGVKTCRIHDLLHNFCLQKAKDEHFFHFIRGYDELLAFNEPRNLQRLCIHSEPEHFRQSKLFCPGTRSLLFNSSQKIQSSKEEPVLLDISFVIDIFKLLKVLDLEQINLRSRFPSEIVHLFQLAFLAIRGNMCHIPSSIANLSNLETFIVDLKGGTLSLPDSLWNLRKLKYFYIRSSRRFGGGCLPIENLDSSSVLHELDRFSGAIIPFLSSMERLMRKFPKIRKLKCKWDNTENLDKIVVPDFLNQLESLSMLFYGLRGSSRTFEFSLPLNLKKLTLSGFKLHGNNISTIGKLPSLEVLKLLQVSFEGEIWEMKEDEFLKLRILELSSFRLIRWRGCDDQFVCFQKLVLERCHHLEELPYCLNYIETFEMIEVSYCPDTVVNLVRQIEQEREQQLGDSGLKIIIRSSK